MNKELEITPEQKLMMCDIEELWKLLERRTDELMVLFNQGKREEAIKLISEMYITSSLIRFRNGEADELGVFSNG